MALTKELITANEVLNGLSEDQVNALVQLSANDENQVIGKKVSEIHKSYDEDIKAITGKEKPGTVKTYEFLKQVLNEQKTALQGLETLKEEKEALEAKVKSGKVDEALKGKFEALEGQYNALLQKYEEDTKAIKNEYDNRLKEYDTEIKRGLIWEQLRDLKLKPNEVVPKSVKDVLLDNAEKALLSGYDLEIQKTDTGRTLVFKDKESGVVKTNPEKGLAPFTALDLVTKMPFMADVIDKGRKQEGAGTKGGATVNGAINTSGAKTQSEAAEMITQSLMAQGLARGTTAFQEKMDQAWKDNDIQSLPIQ